MAQQLENTKDQEINIGLIHQIITAYRASLRAGTKAQKTRAEVSGGGAKPWRQKGTGRARAGTTRSPIWRTGGVTFAAKPRKFHNKVNKKMYHLGLVHIVAELEKTDRLIKVADFKLDTAKTKDLVQKIKEHNTKRLLIVVKDTDKNLAQASKNLAQVKVITVKNITPLLLVAAEKTVITEEAYKELKEMLS